jgi:hypothetical protein
MGNSFGKRHDFGRLDVVFINYSAMQHIHPIPFPDEPYIDRE